MLTRIVRLTFDQTNIAQFLQIFKSKKDFIIESRGCHSVELKQHIKYKSVLFTVSEWESEEHLNNYRKSDLFKETWKETKSLFSAPPEAWSLINVKE